MTKIVFNSPFTNVEENTNGSTIVKKTQPPRFFLKQGQDSSFIIISETPFYAFEHTLQDEVTKYWNIHEYCPQETSYGCPLCDKGHASYGLYLTILEIRGNDPYNYELKTLVARGKNIKFIEDCFHDRDSTRGIIIKASRPTGTKYAIGDLTYEDEISEDVLTSNFGKENIIPYDYKESHNPSVADLVEKYGGELSVGGFEMEFKND